MSKFKEIPDAPGHLMFDCPGCGFSHQINTYVNTGEPVWQFNGNLDKPTVTPSIRVRWPEKGVEKCCHSFITGGRIQFLTDCTHSLAGQTVELPEF